MFFKNIFVFAFTRPFALSAQALIEHLNTQLYTPCKSTDLSHFGWCQPFGKHGKALVEEQAGNLLICAKHEEKIIPASVVNDHLDLRISQLEFEQGRSPTKKEKEQFKEDIIFDLLPRAFSKYSITQAYISPVNNIIVVNSSSRSKAEDLLALLRKCLGTLRVTSFSPSVAPDETMTNLIVEQNLPEVFSMGHGAKLSGIGDHAPQIGMKNCDLNSEEVKAHIDAERYVTRLSLEYDNCMSFDVCDDLSIKAIKYFDVLTEQNDDIDKDDIKCRLEADLLLMSSETNRMINDVLAIFSLASCDYLDNENEAA